MSGGGEGNIEAERGGGGIPCDYHSFFHLSQSRKSADGKGGQGVTLQPLMYGPRDRSVFTWDETLHMAFATSKTGRASGRRRPWTPQPQSSPSTPSPVQTVHENFLLCERVSREEDEKKQERSAADTPALSLVAVAASAAEEAGGAQELL